MQGPGQSHANEDQLARIVRLSGQDVRAAARLLGLITQCDNPDEQEQPRSSTTAAAEHLAKAKAIVDRRHLRARHFNPAMFGEPAWDMLLALYINAWAGDRLTTVKLANGIDVPLSSAIRWLSYLEKERLIEREPHPTDRRISFLKLSSKARAAVEQYLSNI